MRGECSENLYYYVTKFGATHGFNAFPATKVAGTEKRVSMRRIETRFIKSTLSQKD